jgi:hypothetical protein
VCDRVSITFTTRHATAVLSTVLPHRNVETLELSTFARLATRFGSVTPASISDAKRCRNAVDFCVEKVSKIDVIFVATDHVRRITCEARSTSVHTAFPQELTLHYLSERGHLARYRQQSTFAIHMSYKDLWKTSLLHFPNGLSTLPSPRLTRDRATTDFAIPSTCISSSVLDRKNRSKTRLVPRCSRRRGPGVERMTRGMGSGRRSQTTISCAARRTMEQHGGSASKMTRRLCVSPSRKL